MTPRSSSDARCWLPFLGSLVLLSITGILFFCYRLLMYEICVPCTSPFLSLHPARMRELSCCLSATRYFFYLTVFCPVAIKISL